MPFRINESAAAEMTAFAAGAGPPAKTMAARRIGLSAWGGWDKDVDITYSKRYGLRRQFTAARETRLAGQNRRNHVRNVRSTNVVSIRPSWNAAWARIS